MFMNLDLIGEQNDPLENLNSAIAFISLGQ